MSSNLKIYSFVDLIPASLQEVLDSVGVEMMESYEGVSCDLVIADSVEQVESEFIGKVLYLGTTDFSLLFGRPGVAYLDPEVTGIESHQLKRFITGKSSLQIDQAYTDELISQHSLKIVDTMAFGHYGDIIMKSSSDQGLNFIEQRTCWSSICSFILYLQKAEAISIPLDVDYGNTLEQSIVQIVIPSENIFQEYFLEGFKDEGKGPHQWLLKQVIGHCHSFEIFYLEKSQKLVFNLIFGKGNKSNSHLIIHSLPSFGKISGQKIGGKIALIKEIQDKPVPNLPGEGLSKLGVGHFDNANNLLQIKKIVEFVLRLKNDNEIEGELEHSTFDAYLSLYPEMKALESLTNEDRKLIYDTVNNSDLLDELEESAVILKNNIKDDDFLDNVLRKVESMDFDEVKTLVKGGGTIDEGNDVVRIQGVTENLDKDVWRVKRLEVAKSLEEGFESIKGSGKSHNEMESEVKQLLSEQFTGDFDSEINEFIVDSSIEEKVNETMKGTAEDVRGRLQSEKLRNSVRIRDNQLIKMKKVMDGMKTEIAALRESANDNELIGNSLNENLPENKEDFDSAIKKLKADLMGAAKERILAGRKAEKTGEEHSAELSEKDAEIRDLEEKVLELTEKLDSGEAEEVVEPVDAGPNIQEYEKEADELSQENRKLEEKVIELENTLNEKTLHLEQVASDKTDTGKGEALLKEKLSAQVEELNEFKAQNRDLEEEKKALQLTVKSFEQKMKVLEGKIKSAEEQKQMEPAQAEPGNDKKSLDMEKRYQTMEAALVKMKKEIAVKKTEAHKHALENKTMKTKMHTLERQVANLSKRKIA